MYFLLNRPVFAFSSANPVYSLHTLIFFFGLGIFLYIWPIVNQLYIYFQGLSFRPPPSRFCETKISLFPLSLPLPSLSSRFRKGGGVGVKCPKHCVLSIMRFPLPLCKILLSLVKSYGCPMEAPLYDTYDRGNSSNPVADAESCSCDVGSRNPLTHTLSLSLSLFRWIMHLWTLLFSHALSFSPSLCISLSLSVSLSLSLSLTKYLSILSGTLFYPCIVGPGLFFVKKWISIIANNVCITLCFYISIK